MRRWLGNFVHYQQQPQEQTQQEQQEQPQRQAGRVLFMAYGPQPSARSDDIVIIDSSLLKSFIRRVYMYGVIFILATSITWLAISGAQVSFQKAVPVPVFVWALLGGILVTIYYFVPKVRYTFPYNWLLIILVVILSTFFGAILIEPFRFPTVLAFIGMSLVLNCIFVAHGGYSSQKFQPRIYCPPIVMFLLFLLILIFLILLIVLKNPVIGLLLAILVFFHFILATPYESEYIHGRLGIVPLYDALYCGLIICFSFHSVFLSTLYIYFYSGQIKKEL